MFSLVTFIGGLAGGAFFSAVVKPLLLAAWKWVKGAEAAVVAKVEGTPTPTPTKQ